MTKLPLCILPLLGLILARQERTTRQGTKTKILIACVCSEWPLSPWGQGCCFASWLCLLGDEIRRKVRTQVSACAGQVHSCPLSLLPRLHTNNCFVPILFIWLLSFGAQERNVFFSVRASIAMTHKTKTDWIRAIRGRNAMDNSGQTETCSKTEESPRELDALRYNRTNIDARNSHAEDARNGSVRLSKLKKKKGSRQTIFR